MTGTTPNGSGVRAVSVARPWAGLIVRSGKDVENRTWPTSYRGRLVIHASQRWDAHATDLATAAGLPSAAREHPCGYLGTVDLVGVHHARQCRGGCSLWAEPDSWHWVLLHPHALPAPLPGPGRLGLFTPPAAVTDAILTNLTGGTHDRRA